MTCIAIVELLKKTESANNIPEALNLGKLLVMKRFFQFRTFVPWVLETFKARFPVSVKSSQSPTQLRPSAEDPSASGRPRSILSERERKPLAPRVAHSVIVNNYDKP